MYKKIFLTSLFSLSIFGTTFAINTYYPTYSEYLQQYPVNLQKLWQKLIQIREKYIKQYWLEEWINKYLSFNSKIQTKIRYLKNLPKYSKYRSFLNRVLDILIFNAQQSGRCTQKLLWIVEHPYLEPVEKYCPLLLQDSKWYLKKKQAEEKTLKQIQKVLEQDLQTNSSSIFNKYAPAILNDIRKFIQELNQTPDSELETKYKNYLQNNNKFKKIERQNSKKFMWFNNNPNPELVLPEKRILQDIASWKINIGYIDNLPKQQLQNLIQKNKQELEKLLDIFNWTSIKRHIKGRLIKVKPTKYYWKFIVWNYGIHIKKSKQYDFLTKNWVISYISRLLYKDPNQIWFYYQSNWKYHIILVNPNNVQIYPIIAVKLNNTYTIADLIESLNSTNYNPNIKYDDFRKRIITTYILNKLWNQDKDINIIDNRFILLWNNLYYFIGSSFNGFNLNDIKEIFDLSDWILTLNFDNETKSVSGNWQILFLDKNISKYLIYLWPIELYKNTDILSLKSFLSWMFNNYISTLEKINNNYDSVIEKFRQDYNSAMKKIAKFYLHENPRKLSDIYDYIANTLSYDYAALKLFLSWNTNSYKYLRAEDALLTLKRWKGVCSWLSNLFNLFTVYAWLPVGNYSWLDHQVSIVYHRSYDITADINKNLHKWFNAMPIMLWRAKSDTKNKTLSVNYPEQYRKYLYNWNKLLNYMKQYWIKIRFR